MGIFYPFRHHNFKEIWLWWPESTTTEIITLSSLLIAYYVTYEAIVLMSFSSAYKQAEIWVAGGSTGSLVTMFRGYWSAYYFKLDWLKWNLSQLLIKKLVHLVCNCHICTYCLPWSTGGRIIGVSFFSQFILGKSKVEIILSS